MSLFLAILLALRLRCYLTVGVRVAVDSHIISSCVCLLEAGQHLLMLCKYLLQAQMTFCLCSSTLSFMPTPLSWLLIWSTSSASGCTAGWCQSLHTSLHSWSVFTFHAVIPSILPCCNLSNHERPVLMQTVIARKLLTGFISEISVH